MTEQVTVEKLLEQLKRIPAEWLDEDGQRVHEAIPMVLDRLDDLELSGDLIRTMLMEDPYSLDVFRLFIDMSQDVLANEMKAGGVKGDFTSIRGKCNRNADRIADVLIDLGLLDIIKARRAQVWTLQDVLWDRYSHMRGRAIAAQKRGAALEDSVENILKELQTELSLPYYRGGNFTAPLESKPRQISLYPQEKSPRSSLKQRDMRRPGASSPMCWGIFSRSWRQKMMMLITSL